jgi:hypothetical protein
MRQKSSSLNISNENNSLNMPEKVINLKKKTQIVCLLIPYWGYSNK